MRYALTAAATSPGSRFSPGVDHVGEAARLPELRDDVTFDPLDGHLVVDRIAARLHHPLDEVAELGQRLLGRLLHERLQGLPLRLPFVLVEARLEHGSSMVCGGGFETPPVRSTVAL
ncbi:MAG: hypothetical protein ABR521_12950 [Gaiellaceae bacterium]